MIKPVLITVNGTGISDPFGPGFAGDLGRAFMFDEWAYLQAKIGGVVYDTGYFWQPIGYRAAVFPMRPSVDEGIGEVSRQISMRPKGTPLVLAGYSQGEVVTAEVLRHLFLPADGAHHDRLKDLRGAIGFGGPLRCPGIARGNELCGMPAPTKLDGQTTGGIAGPDVLTPAESELTIECALDGDLYACCPTGDNPWNTPRRGGGENEAQVGQIETRIYEFIMSGSLARGFMAICEGIAEEFGSPISATVAHFQALANGLRFASAGMTAPHWRYEGFIGPLVDWLRNSL